mmetsp:Transcript_96315/g.272336  ORF Transcript_96315/g.272336 Transcript_96315/m.272336 type:complete len:421 (-) Transcript_96315:228-1490(-)
MGKKINRRKTWRKNKIEDVEEALEDERLVQKLRRKAGPSKDDAEKDDADDLFVVDVAGSGEGLSKKTRRQLAREKLFPQKGPNIGLSASEQAKVARAGHKLAARKPQAKGQDVFDLWATPPPVASATEFKTEFPCIRGRKALPASVPKTLHQKVGLAPAVLPAHEGQSMNPKEDAYEDLACTAAAEEIAREREQEELDRKMRPITHELRDVADADTLKGMSEEEKLQMYRSMMGQRQEGDEAADEEGGPTRKGARRQKSQAHRNKQKVRAVEDEKTAQLLAQKRLEKSVGEVGSILKDMKAKAEWEENRRKYRQARLSEKRTLEETEGVVPKRRKLGRTKFVEEALVVPDAESAKKGLRATRLKGSAIKDRLSSIMRRGLLPAPPEASRSEMVRHSKTRNKVRNRKKFISPLLRESRAQP